MGEIRIVVLDADPLLEDIRTIKRELRKTNRALGVLMTQFTDLRDELAGVFADLAAKLQRLQDAIDNPANGETVLSAEDQATLDEIKASVDAARATVGDENADGTPA